MKGVGSLNHIGLKDSRPLFRLDVDSVILSDALRQFDYRERSMQFIAKCPRAILDEVTIRSLSLIDPEAEF
jgi:hypothetical protein